MIIEMLEIMNKYEIVVKDALEKRTAWKCNRLNRELGCIWELANDKECDMFSLMAEKFAEAINTDYCTARYLLSKYHEELIEKFSKENS